MPIAAWLCAGYRPATSVFWCEDAKFTSMQQLDGQMIVAFRSSAPATMWAL